MLNNTLMKTLAVFLVLLTLTFALRFKHLDTPFERDEGEYAYAAQLMLDGLPPYQNMYSMKLPGIFFVYAGIFLALGQSVFAVHLSLIIVNSFTSFLIFLLGRRMFGPIPGLAAALCHLLLSAGYELLGFTANAEHFVILPVLAGLLLLHKTLADKRNLLIIFMAGLLFGAGFTIKQHGLFFGIFGGLWIVATGLSSARKTLIEGFCYSIGCILPYSLICLAFAILGIFDDFWFWTVEYASKYASMVPVSFAIKTFAGVFSEIFTPAFPLWIFALYGAVSLFFNKDIQKHKSFLLFFLLFSFLAICPGFYFRPHYFLLTLPVISLLFGAGVVAISSLLNLRTSALVVTVTLLSSLVPLYFFYFILNPDQALKFRYDSNPFFESVMVARELRKITKPGDRIMILGSEPQIYFYSHRRGSTGYIYMYPMMEQHDFAIKMRLQLLKDIEQNPPQAVVFVSNHFSWLSSKASAVIPLFYYNHIKKSHRTHMVLDLKKSGLDISYGQSSPAKRSGNWLEILVKKDK